MIKHIYIDNYRCFSNFELKPDRMNLLLGANGSGKSSCVDVFDHIIGLIVDGREVAEIFTENDLMLWDTREEQRFEIELDANDMTFTYSMVLEKTLKGMTLKSERVTRDRDVLFRYENGDVHLYKNDGSEGTKFALRGNRSFLAGIEERPETTDLMVFLRRMGNLRTYKLVPSRIVSLTQEEQQRLLKSGSNFASWYRHLSQERAGAI